jgi:hypothetical protein
MRPRTRRRACGGRRPRGRAGKRDAADSCGARQEGRGRGRGRGGQAAPDRTARRVRVRAHRGVCHPVEMTVHAVSVECVWYMYIAILAHSPYCALFLQIWLSLPNVLRSPFLSRMHASSIRRAMADGRFPPIAFTHNFDELPPDGWILNCIHFI